MDKKGQTLGLAILTSLFVLIAGFTLLNFLLPEIDNTRIALSCASASTISDGTKLFCLMIDGTVPYFIVLIFSIMIGGITARLSL